jgi:hypothetical protein
MVILTAMAMMLMLVRSSATGVSDAQLAPLYSQDFFATIAFTLHSNST